ncbi:MAG: type IX secretion system membrane protein PorP/SprF [Saprospiraceae bacterium]|nr:type IX secretion system membrane protein PorP/SprF [Saprospiraceae bacterium]
MIRFYIWCCLLLATKLVVAQQDPSLTTYRFNSLHFNPAYAGSQGYLTMNLTNRNQWLGWSDKDSKAPITQALSAHSPLNTRVGLGITLMNDRIGVSGFTSLNLAYTYRISLREWGTLSAGLQGGFFNWRSDWNKLSFQDEITFDPAFNEGRFRQILPNIGAGIYFQSDKYYVGLAAPRLIHHDVGTVDVNTNVGSYSRLYRHTYFMAGGIFPILSEAIVFRPALLVRKVGNFGKAKRPTFQTSSPTAIDVEMSLFFLETLWLGINYRTALEGTLGSSSSHDSIDFWAAYYLKNGFRLGFAYDISLTPIQQYSGGSLEIMLGYDFNYKVGKIKSPRYF